MSKTGQAILDLPNCPVCGSHVLGNECSDYFCLYGKLEKEKNEVTK